MDIQYSKQIALRDTRGALGDFRGSNIQKSEEAVNRLERLAPTLLHVCGFIWKWTYLNTIRPSIPQGAFRVVTNLSLGKLPNGWTDWHQIRYTSVDSSGNGHRIKTIRSTILHGGILGGLGGQQFKSLGNVVKRLDRLGINVAHIMHVNLGMDTG